MDKMKLQEIFPIGTKYSAYRDRTDKNWEKDFSNMQKCGMDTVRVHATWGTIEANEGEFDFTYYDNIISAAVKYGLKVIFTMYLVCAPEWVYEKYPDSRYVSAGGNVWTPHQQADAATGGWPGLCLDSEPHRGAIASFLKAITEHYKGNADIIAFDIWHEPTEEPSQQYYQNDWRELVYCYCDHTKEKFRKWLVKKYGTLESLNEVWTRQYQNWSQVQPPKSVGMYTDWLDWKHFRADAQADAMKFLSETIKKYDKDRYTVVHTAIYETGHPVVTSNDHFKLADVTDMIGSSMYDSVNPEITAFVCDLLRSVTNNGPYWIGETGTGAGPMFVFVGERTEDSFCFSLPISGKTIKRQTWGQIARGAKGVIFWGWRPELSTVETISLGFTERNGDWTERCDALKEFTDVFRKYKSKLAYAMAPESEAAILYNMDSIFIEGLVSLGTSGSCMIRKQNRFYKDSLAFMGCYKLCMQNLIQPDFINADKVLAGGLEKYKLLLIPYGISITQELAAALRIYVKNGGKIISDGMLGYFTDKAWGAEVCPAGGLDEVFGLDVKSDYCVINEQNLVIEDHEYHNVAKVIAEHIKVRENAEVFGKFENGRPAAIAHSYGKGKTAYVGTLFFANAMWHYSGDTNEVFCKLLEKVEYSPKAKLCGPGSEQLVEVRVLEGKDEAFLFLINHDEKAACVELSVPMEGYQQITDIMTDEKKSVQEGNVSVKDFLQPEEVKVFMLNKIS